MKTRIARVSEWAPTALAGLGVVFAAIATLNFALANIAWGAVDEQRVVKVTGIHVPVDGSGEFLVYTDQGTFSVSDHLRTGRMREDPWFLFTIGSQYRISSSPAARGRSMRGTLPEIHDAIRIMNPQLAALTASND